VFKNEQLWPQNVIFVGKRKSLNEFSVKYKLLTLISIDFTKVG